MEYFQEKYKEHKVVFNIFFAFTFAMLTLMVALRPLDIFNIIIILISTIVSFVVAYLVLSKTNIVEEVKDANLGYKFISLLFLSKFLGVMMLHLDKNKVMIKGLFLKTFNLTENVEIIFSEFYTLLQLLVCVLIIPVSYLGILYLINKFVPKILEFFKGLNKEEKRYLKVFNITLGVFCIVLFFITTIFTSTVNKYNEVCSYDAIFTTDTGAHIVTDSFKVIDAGENDLRQPLFGLANMPFGLLAEVVSGFFYFIPGRNLYALCIQLIQVFAVSICAIMLSRMVCKDKKQTGFLALYSVMFSTLLFTLTVEQYVFANFWLILVIYNCVQYGKTHTVTFSFAAGSLLTSGIVLPFMFNIKDFKNYIKNCFKYGMIFLLIIVICGNASKTLDGVLKFNNDEIGYTRFMGKEITFKDKINQFTNMIVSCFVSPETVEEVNLFKFDSIQLKSVDTVNVIGVILLVLMVISFIINHKKKIVKVSFGWLLFSILIIVVIGWGAQENGMILYSLYFGWAYLVLLFELLENILDKIMLKHKNIIYIILVGILFVINLVGIFKFVGFGLRNYPSIF